MALRAVTGDGASAVYTTSGPDQCISFTRISLMATNGMKRNWRINVLAGPGSGNVIGQYIQCQLAQKGYTAPFLQTGTHYLITVPPVVYSGQKFWITVTVVDSANSIKTEYCGTTSFTSTDPTANMEGFPMDTYNYTWSSNVAPCNSGSDNGVKLFYSVQFTRLGMQTIIAMDITDGSITGVTALMVVGVDVKLTKKDPLAISATGDVVQFRICWSNYSSSSALSFVITDAVPMGTTYIQQIATNHVCGTTSPIVYDLAFSTATSSTPPGTFTTTTGTPLTETRWLRWSIKSVDVNTTGCACFKVKVD